ncbi:Phosphoprotein phosphatase [Bertholletia excelsa]
MSHDTPDCGNINCQNLVVSNIGDSRAVISKNGMAKQLFADHEPSKGKTDIEDRSGFVANFLGIVARVDGQLAVAGAFGDKSLKKNLSSEPGVVSEIKDDDKDFAILTSDSMRKAVDYIKEIKDAKWAAKLLIEGAPAGKGRDANYAVALRLH